MRAKRRFDLPDLGVGVGLRVPHYRVILADRPPVDFFEIISENFMVAGGRPLYHLDRVLETYRVVQHGVSLGIGGPAEPDREYLSKLKALVRRTKTPWVSDHFCWCGTASANLHDLLPLPYTEEVVELVVERARRIQDYLEVPLALENTSSYLTFTASSMTEWQFIAEIAERADVGLLFDVNNVYVSAFNHGFDPFEFVRSVPHERIVQIHVAGHTHRGTHLIDTHRGPVIDPVWALYRATLEHAGSVPTLVEWDDEIPELSVVLAEADKARGIRDSLETGGAAPGTTRSPPAAVALDAADAPRSPWTQGGPREIAGSDVAEDAR